MLEELTIVSIEELKGLKIYVMCPGLTKDEISLSFNMKNGLLEIFGKPSKESALTEKIDLTIKGKVTIPDRYRSKDIKMNVDNGVLEVDFKLSDNINIIECE